jgi:putative transposase
MILAATAAGLSVRQLCTLFGVNRAWYYAHRAAAADDPDVELRAAIERLALEFPRYGYRRVTAALRRAGWAVNHKRVLRVMREEA